MADSGVIPVPSAAELRDAVRRRLELIEAQRDELLAACERAHAFICNLKVPQTTQDAAIQVWLGSQVIRAIESALAKVRGGTP